MTAPSLDREYHVVCFEATGDAAAFVAALSRYLNSPVGNWYLEATESVEVWSFASPIGVELYLSDGALEAASAAFPPVPVIDSRQGRALPGASALMIGGEWLPAWGMREVESFMLRRSA